MTFIPLPQKMEMVFKTTHHSKFHCITGKYFVMILPHSVSLSDFIFLAEIYSRGPKGKSGNKEPNLMPVPSPQQIQYLNAFEGQELTIQKQPNTSLKEPSSSSPM